MTGLLGRVALATARATAASEPAAVARVYQALPRFQRAYLARSILAPSTSLSHRLANRSYATTGGRPRRGAATAGASKKKAPAKKSTQTPKRKVAAKKKLVPKKKKVPSEAQKAKANRAKALEEIKTLRSKALSPPERKPYTALTVFAVEQKGLFTGVQDFQTKFKALDASAKEDLEKTAEHNKMENQLSYRNWILNYSPEEIRQANVARKRLRRRVLLIYPNRKVSSQDYAIIKDERQPKRASSAYTIYFTERVGSDTFKGVRMPDATKLISKEWKEMSSSEKKRHEDLADADKLRYEREFKAAYGYDKPPSRSSSASP